ncbi:MAG: RHS repeat-associated core domain-containing protein, partial [Verrucomicrobiae bacterium]|nr:RHS repeat-associated core domain-containing protein [Verrucomicrobiae bacterium]
MGDGDLTGTRTYDTLDRLQSIGYVRGGGQTVTSHAYTYDAAHRRTRADREDGSFWQYGYNDRNEVTAAAKHLPGGALLAGWQQAFQYDNLGNRQWADEGGDSTGGNLRRTVYSANALNQYASLDTPGAFDVLGKAHTEAAVTVNGEAATRQGEYWRREVTADNAGQPVFETVTVEATRAGVGVNGQDVVTRRAGGVFVNPAFLEPVHDADGNLVSDGRWLYAWDGENRLLAMETGPAALQAGAPRERYDFAYDSQWRRVRQIVRRWDANLPGADPNTLGNWAVAKEERYLYDAWNLVAIVDGAGAWIQSLVWGTDLSGTPQGAGGVGGLLAVFDSGIQAQDGAPRAWVYAYDGNGNVSAVVDAGTPSDSALYDYDAFGRTILEDGNVALREMNRFRFSTKFTDGTGLLYYGFRYYSTKTGRWLNRDPIEEDGGWNLYGFIDNVPTVDIDVLGRERFRPGNALRRGVAVVVSVPTGDWWPDFAEPPYAKDQCSFLITVTGINMTDDAQRQFARTVHKNNYPEIPVVAPVRNYSAFRIKLKKGGHVGVGDLTQIVMNELTGLADRPATFMARKIR